MWASFQRGARPTLAVLGTALAGCGPFVGVTQGLAPPGPVASAPAPGGPMSQANFALTIGQGQAAAQPAPTATFHEPPALANTARTPGVVEVDLRAGPARVDLLPDRGTDVWAYNGSVPGPTLTAHEGDHVVVHFSNGLAAATNIHWHGLPTPPSQDGMPMDLVAPGASRDYAFDVPKGVAGTYWYHPHPHGAAAEQVMRGLYGAIRILAAEDPLPPAFGDALVVLWDARFAADGAFAPVAETDRMDGREGDTVFVNGRHAPRLALRPGEVRRLRVVNASPSRFYALAAPGATLVQVGTDGGMFEAPVERATLPLAPGERAEVLLSGPAGTEVTLRSRAVERGAMGMGARRVANAGVDGSFPLMTLGYGTGVPVAAMPVPERLRHVPPMALTGAKARTLVFTEAMERLDFRINDATFDPARIDFRARLGTTEVWSLDNRGDMDHPFHLHGFRFQVLDRDGRPEPFAAWKDTVDVRKDERVRFAVKLDGVPGLRVYHCHILDHEDLGMMGTLQVE